MKRKAGIILAIIMLCGLASFYWVETQKTAELKGLTDLQQDIIAEQQIEIADRYTEIDDLYIKLSQQSNNIKDKDLIIEAQTWEIKQLKAEIGSYDFISGWAYKPWQSKAELKDWLRANDVSEREYVRDGYNCVNFSDDLFFDALADNRVVGKMREPGHQFNFAIVGNDIFSIEPKNDKITKDGVVD